MSGYPSRTESEHDIVENSHASTAVSYAYGLAVARDTHRCRRREVVAVIGDGALTGGLAYEALEQLRAQRAPRGDRAQRQRTVLRADRVASHRGRGRRSVGVLQGARARLHRADRRARHRRARAGAARRRRPRRGPVVVHVLTRKGEGYLPAETDDEKRLHDVGAFDPETGVPVGANGSSYTAAFSDRADRARRIPAGDRRAHRRHARLHRAPAVRGALPRPLLRRRDRRAARGHRGCGHGDARPPPGGGGLLHLPQPGVGPDRLRRRACTRCRSCSASTGPASPATTAPATTASTTSRCSPRFPGSRCSRRPPTRRWR